MEELTDCYCEVLLVFLHLFVFEFLQLEDAHGHDVHALVPLHQSLDDLEGLNIGIVTLRYS